MTALVLDGLNVALGRRRVVRDVTLTIAPGAFVGLIGPNGAGKSSLMRAALGLIPADGRSNLAAMPAPERARTAAWLPQSREIAWDVSVETLVALGRAPHRRPGAPLSDRDRAAIRAAMARTDTEGFADRPATALSGGEQARALLARALAQETPILLADEPTAALDPSHQIATMECFAALAGEGRTVVAALHDLGLAARWCSRLVLMYCGRVVADGPPAEVLTAERLRTVYGIEAHIAATDGALIVQPLTRAALDAAPPAMQDRPRQDGG